MSEASSVAQEPPPPEPPAQPSTSVLQNNYKSKVQEYTQKSSLQLPVYRTVNEGAQHTPKFRSTVCVDGRNYTSPIAFTNKKAAEQDAARVAFKSIMQKMKDDGCPLIRQDTTFCKSILNEYAVKKNVEKPTYSTIQQEGLLPAFVSSLVFNGISYIGDIGRNKKEAEQLAARATILSILDSESGEALYEIIKSKFNLYAALNKIKNTNSCYSAAMPIVNTGDGPSIRSNKRKEAEATHVDINVPITGISGSSLDETDTLQAAPASLHEFKQPKQEMHSTVALPIVFVSAGFEQPLFPSTSGVKRSRKKKKKANKNLQVDTERSSAVVAVHQITPCSVAQ